MAGTLSACGAPSGHLAASAAAARSESVRQRIAAVGVGGAALRARGRKARNALGNGPLAIAHFRVQTLRLSISFDQRTKTGHHSAAHMQVACREL